MSIKKEYTSIENVISKVILGFYVDKNRLLYVLQEVSKMFLKKVLCNYGNNEQERVLFTVLFMSYNLKY